MNDQAVYVEEEDNKTLVELRKYVEYFSESTTKARKKVRKEGREE